MYLLLSYACCRLRDLITLILVLVLLMVVAVVMMKTMNRLIMKNTVMMVMMVVVLEQNIVIDLINSGGGSDVFVGSNVSLSPRWYASAWGIPSTATPTCVAAAMPHYAVDCCVCGSHARILTHDVHTIILPCPKGVDSWPVCR